MQNENAYQVKRKLGNGSFGCVYLVSDVKSNQEFACKIVSKSMLGKYQAEGMVRQEIQIQSSINHRNVVKVFNSFEDTKNIYIILEYCKQGQLQLPSQPYTNKQLIQFLNQMLSALDSIHQMNLVHRDIKLDNILVHEDGTYKISDFGWATQISQIKPILCGTTEYMPPEVVNNQIHDHKVDSWSLGIVLYILTHCRKPFSAKTDRELIKQISENEIEIDTQLDENLQILIQALLTKDPSYRPNIQQLYFSKWIKFQMKQHKIFNRYEHEKLKNKFRNQKIEIKSVDNRAIQLRKKKQILQDCSLSHSISTQLSNCDMNESGIIERQKQEKL
ncbi:unnamed protein product [Paramecium octaurelia]|uniref:Protein kinase domain-containing protein n=1 Tax=Paramecium octaurelia TaxID=43137 RepID=A0A8S1XUW6_PAROT|nr:unnamed protein product [Paramecium octaurelia]